MKDDMGSFTNPNKDVTYVEGFGFMPQNYNRQTISKIRMTANKICIILLIYYPCKHFFLLPITNLCYLLGLNITINNVTGLVVISQESKLIVQLCTNVISLLIILLLYYIFFHRAYISAQMFRRPNSGITSIAIPMITAAGLLSISIAFLFEQLTRFFGVIFDSFELKINDFSLFTNLSLISILIIAILQEIIFRGAILTPLRRFGDEFAITVSALLYAICTNNPISAITAFLFGIAAGYFTVRAGSIHVAIFSRILFELFLFGFRIANGMLNAFAKSIIIPAVGILIFIAALLAYLRFIRADKNAFKLLNSFNTISTSKKIGIFCTSFGFLILMILMVSRIINTVQIIG